MVAGPKIFGEDLTGRSGLQDVTVTPIHYLIFLERLENGYNVSYNRKQLDLAFRNYLRTTKGPWTGSPEAKKSEKFLDIAVHYVSKQKKKFDEESQKLQGKSPSSRHKKQEALLKKLGLVTEDGHKMPKQLRHGAQTGMQRDMKMLSAIEKGTDIVQVISTIGEPTTTVALSLILIAVESKMTDAVCKMLLKEYDTKADNSPEKEVILSALEKVMGPQQRAALNDDIDEVLSKESDPKYQRELNKLKPKSEKADTEDKKQAFRENFENSSLDDLSRQKAKNIWGIQPPKPSAKWFDNHRDDEEDEK